MAKIIITENTNVKINGITRPVVGDILFISRKLNGGNIIAKYVDEEKEREFGNGILCLLYNGTDLRPYCIQYRSIWGVASQSVKIDDTTVSRTPQTHSDATRILFSKGSGALDKGGELFDKALEIEQIYTGIFTKKDGKGTYNWDLLGLKAKDAKLTYTEDTVQINGQSFKLADLQKGFDEIEKAQNERLANL